MQTRIASTGILWSKAMNPKCQQSSAEYENPRVARRLADKILRNTTNIIRFDITLFIIRFHRCVLALHNLSNDRCTFLSTIWHKSSVTNTVEKLMVPRYCGKA